MLALSNDNQIVIACLHASMMTMNASDDNALLTTDIKGYGATVPNDSHPWTVWRTVNLVIILFLLLLEIVFLACIGQAGLCICDDGYSIFIIE